jgi:heat shock protein HslJ
MRRIWMVSVMVAVVVGLVGCDTSSGGLVGPTWQWTGLVETTPAHRSVIPTPEVYTITFLQDGTFDAQADCNLVSGSYVVEGDSLRIQLGPMTRAACPADSLSDLYLNLLSGVRSYDVDGSDLTLALAANAGEMQFDRAP